MKMKEGSEKDGLKLNIKLIMASSPITSWQIDGETVETVADFIFLGSKITAAMKLKDAYSLEKSYDQPRAWVFFGRNDAKAETPVLWPPHVKSWLIGKDSDAGRDWGQEEKGTTEDELAGWYHGLDGRESE